MELNFKFKPNPVYPDAMFGQCNLWHLLRSLPLNMFHKLVESKILKKDLNEKQVFLVEKKIEEAHSISNSLRVKKKGKMLIGTLQIPDNSIWVNGRNLNQAQRFFKQILVCKHKVKLTDLDPKFVKALLYHDKIDKKVITQIINSVKFSNKNLKKRIE